MAGNNGHKILSDHTRDFYRRSARALTEAGIPYLVGGAYAFACYTGIVRHTKDFDVFVKPEDLDHALATLEKSGCRTERTFPHWLAKAYCGEDFVDLIYSSGNGIALVDDEWFQYAVPHRVFDCDVLLVPPEEMIWSKSFIQERERYDGADIAHIFRDMGDRLDWQRLLTRFGDHWRILLAQLIMFGFVFPSDQGKVPVSVMQELTAKLAAEIESGAPEDRICRGTLISREQYLVDLERGYRDARLTHETSMTIADVAHWTSAIDSKEHHA